MSRFVGIVLWLMCAVTSREASSPYLNFGMIGTAMRGDSSGAILSFHSPHRAFTCMEGGARCKRSMYKIQFSFLKFYLVGQAAFRLTSVVTP
jgi:hypothetical protein